MGTCFRFMFLSASFAALSPGLYARDDDRQMVGSHWIYDDLHKGFEQAKATGKPMLVVLRCVP
jgi:hypothetical protein